MSDYNLFDHQQHLLWRMVQAIEKGCRHDFGIVQNSMFRGVVFEGDNGLHEQIECDIHDLSALSREGLITLTTRGSGTLTPRGVDAVHSDFVQPSAPVGGHVIYVHGNVGNIQSGHDNVATVQQNFNPDISAVLGMIKECRNLTNSLNEAGQHQSNEALDDLETEIKSGAPKKSKLISYFKSAAEYVSAGTTLYIALENLAKAIGFDSATIATILHRITK